jgi:hypothetical protein
MENMVENVIMLDFNPVLFILIPALLLTVYLQILRFNNLRQKR